MKKPAPAPIHPLLAERWSPRAFDAEAVLSETELVALTEAARWTFSRMLGDAHALVAEWARKHREEENQSEAA